MTDDLRKAIYDQDCQSWRHQDNLTWGRFLTAATIEAGMLYGLYQTQIVPLEKMLLALFGGTLVFLVGLLSLKDNVDARGHLKRAALVESSIAPWKPEPWFGPRGTTLLRTAVVLINVANLILLIKFSCAYLCK